MTTNDVDLNIIVQEDAEVKTTKYNGKYTKSALFLLPMFELSVRNRLVSKYLNNAFLDDKGIEHDFSDSLFILFKVKNLREKDWQDLCKLMTSKELIKSNLILDYYVGTKDEHHLVMYVLKIPERYLADFNNFKEGKYSKISKEYQSRFPEKVVNAAGQQVESLVWGAMHKSNSLKDLITKEFNVDKTEKVYFRKFVETLPEIWDSPKEEEEIYRYGTEPDKTLGSRNDCQVEETNILQS